MGPNITYEKKTQESIVSTIPTEIDLENDAQPPTITNDLDFQPTEEDLRQLRRISGPIP